MPLDPVDLRALSGIAAPAHPRPLPRRPAVAGLPAVRVPRPDADAVRQSLAAARRSRLASYAAGAAAAGLLCGLVGPSPAALAAPVAAVVRGTLVPVSAVAPADARPAPAAVVPASSAALEHEHENAQPRTPAEALAAVAGALPEAISPAPQHEPEPAATLDPPDRASRR